MSLIKGVIKTAVVIKLAEVAQRELSKPENQRKMKEGIRGFNRPPGHAADSYYAFLIRPAVVADAVGSPSSAQSPGSRRAERPRATTQSIHCLKQA